MNPKEKFYAAKQLENISDWDAAQKAYLEITKLPGRLSIQASRRRASCLMHLQRWNEMRTEVDAVFNSGAAILDADISRRLIVLSYEQDSCEAYRMIDAHIKRWMQSQPENHIQNGQVILTAAPPKSGSTSLAEALAGATGAKKTKYLCFQRYSVSRGLPSVSTLNRLRGVSIVDHCHLAPDPDFMMQVQAMPWVRIAVHFRHPVDMLLSVIDMVLRRRAPIMLLSEPRLVGACPDFVKEWALTRYLPEMLDWMRNWLKFVDSRHPSILSLTTLEQMKDLGQDRLAAQILEKAGLPYLDGVHTRSRRMGNRLSGKGKVTLSQAQRDFVINAVPKTMTERFHWE